MKNDDWFLSLSPDNQKALLIAEGYAKECPHCFHDYVCEIDDGKDCFTLGRRYWVHYCEMDDNMHSEEIFYCPYCGNKLLPEMVSDVREVAQQSVQADVESHTELESLVHPKVLTKF